MGEAGTGRNHHPSKGGNPGEIGDRAPKARVTSAPIYEPINLNSDAMAMKEGRRGSCARHTAKCLGSGEKTPL